MLLLKLLCFCEHSTLFVCLCTMYMHYHCCLSSTACGHAVEHASAHSVPCKCYCCCCCISSIDVMSILSFTLSLSTCCCLSSIATFHAAAVVDGHRPCPEACVECLLLSAQLCSVDLHAIVRIYSTATVRASFFSSFVARSSSTVPYHN